MEKDNALDDNCIFQITVPAHLGAFISSNIRRIMNDFFREGDGFHNNNIYFSDTESLDVES